MEMNEPCVTSYECVDNICDDFGSWHLLEIFSDGSVVHKAETFCKISSVELAMGL